MSKEIVIQAPASKSLSHRTLIAAALANGSSNLRGLLDSDDITRTRGCLEACGAMIATMEDGSVTVTGMAEGPRGGNYDGKQKDNPPPAELFMHESGTTCRLMTAVAAAGHGQFRVDGAPRMQERPMAELCTALKALGVKIAFEREDGFLPMVLDTKGFRKKSVDISLEESSQYLSGLLLGAPLSESETVINLVGKKAVSWPYVALTLRIMEDFKAKVATEVKVDGKWKAVPWRSIKAAVPGELRFRVLPGGYEPAHYMVEADWSNASYFVAAGAVGKNPVRIEGVRADSLQGDRAILDIMSAMGARIDVEFGSVTVHPSKLHGVEVDMGRCPDLVPTVAVAASLAEGPTVIRNVAHLRIKECDRLDASATEIIRAGGKVEVLDDGLRITPVPMKAGESIEFCTYGDHRLAMSTSIFGLAGIKATHDNPDCVGKSFPNFWNEWKKIMEAAG